MSAVNSSLSDREHEALRRAQRAHEPSMEEILASIRTIIAEERDPANATEPRSAPAKAGAPSPAPQPQIVYSKGEPVAPRGPAAPEASPAKVVWRKPEPAAAEASAPPADDNAPLLSPETDRAVSSAFDALSANLAARSAERAEGLARELLRPMLKAWLDEHLPGIVDRLVRAEIERITRAAR